MIKLIKYSLLTLLSVLALNLAAQERTIYEWESNRSYTEGIKNDDASLIMIKNHVQYDFAYEQNNLVLYTTFHKIYRANNDEAVQRVNRIYIPLYNAIDIVAVRARTITKSGKVIELDQSNIKEVKDDEDGAGFKIFAIEGAEVESEIEYFYTKKAQASVFGREYFQYEYPVLNSSFKLTSPANLQWEFKSYNGLPQVAQDENDLVKNRYRMESEEISPIRREEFGSYNANRQRIEFKLAYNAAAGDKKLFTWQEAGQRFHAVLYPIAAEEKEAMAALLKEQNVKKLKSPMDKFAKVEHYVKGNFYIDDQAGQSQELVHNIITNQYGTEKGYVRFFIALLEALEIRHEIVVTVSRKDIRFDGDFESWNYLDDYLIYLPDSDKYMAPYDFATRVGLWPAELSATNGLFIRNIQFEGTSQPASEIRPIPEMPYTNNYDNLDIKVSFSEDFSENNMEVARSFKGYDGSTIKAVFSKANSEQRDEVLKNILTYLGPDADIQEMGVKDEDLSYQNWSEPITIEGKFTAKGFIEQAGDIILFNAGQLIGTQSELYQEAERTTMVENDYNRGYIRKIEIDIPDGYTIQNPDDIDMDVEASDKGRVVYMFKSTHEIKKNKLLITIDEYYDQIYFPLERFEEFRKVINAAADWNKVTLVLEPN